MQNKFEVLILCGGEGRRLRPLVADLPKPMADIAGKPFLNYLIRYLLKNNFHNICFLTGYKSEIIESYALKLPSSIHIRISFEQNPLGTGGAILQAVQNSKFERFVVLNGDTFFPIDLDKFVQTWNPCTAKLALKMTRDAGRFGLVEVDEAGCIVSFIVKGKTALGDLSINGGIYLLDRCVLQPFSKLSGFVSLEQEIFPMLLQNKVIYGQVFDDEFIDIGIPDDYILAQTIIPKLIK